MKALKAIIQFVGISLIIAIIVLIVLMIFGWRPDTIEVDTGPVSIGLKPPNNSGDPTIEVTEIYRSPPSNNNDETCQWLANNFPQTEEAIRSRFDLPGGGRFVLVTEWCGDIVNGFNYEGNTEFILEVPIGGCIDSYHEAYFSHETVDETIGGGLRAYYGEVGALGMTYRAAWCDRKP